MDNEAREDIIGVMDVRIVLNNERVTTLVTYCVKCLTFSDNIDFLAWLWNELVVVYMAWKHGGVSEHGLEQKGDKKKGTVPWSCISYGLWA